MVASLQKHGCQRIIYVTTRCPVASESSRLDFWTLEQGGRHGSVGSEISSGASIIEQVLLKNCSAEIILAYAVNYICVIIMYIKQVIIEGFKSYREQVATESFSSKVNCVVGANGSGKSNFFHAIRFVLSDQCQNLRNEDRHALLHEGAGNQVMTAFVEIVFDNSDNRIPVDKDEVHLRRTIGLKKDEYFLDGKHLTKTEVMNLLESAGFSRSNPYYVVQQGKISSLTLMKDSERLDLLKEIGGTRVYEERRQESLKIMQDTGNKRKQIIQVVQYLDERLRELDEEKEELRQYQQLDKQRKSLEYTIYDKELDDTRKKLVQVDLDREKVSKESTDAHSRLLEAHDKLKDSERESKKLTKDLQGLIKEKEVAEKNKKEAIKRKMQLELDCKDLKEKIEENNRAKDGATRQLKIVQQEIKNTVKELESIRPSYSKKLQDEELLTKGIMDREKKLSILYQKQGRATQFSSKAARDQWLQKEIDDLELVLATHLSQAFEFLASGLITETKILGEIEKLNAQKTNQDDHQKEIASMKSAIEQHNETFNINKKKRDSLQGERKLLWGKENALTSEIEALKSEVFKAEKNLDHATPGDVRRGLNSVRKICKDLGIRGVFGPIIELFDCDVKYFTAVEVTAGNSLFHVVVDSDDTATRIIRQLNSSKGGRVTFIPLNKVKPPHPKYPNISEAVPLMRKLNFPEDYTQAFMQVFARTVVCRDLDVATAVARSDGLDCITLEGDQVSKKGDMTGGYYDHNRSRLRLMKSIKNSRTAINEKEKELKEVRSQLENILYMQKIDADRAYDRSRLEQLYQDVSAVSRQKRSISTAIEKKEKLLSSIQTQIYQLKANIQAKKEEIGTELVDTLAPQERELLSRLNPEIAEMKEKLIAFRTENMEIESRITELETNLSANLRRQEQELEAIIFADETGMRADLESKEKELDEAKRSVEEAKEHLKGVSGSVEAVTRQLSKFKDDKDKWMKEEGKHKNDIQRLEKDLEQHMSNKNMLLAKQEEYSKKIRELGTLSSDAFDMYRRKSMKELHKMLHRCNEQLQQFSHVNKKALDQYMSFTEQREQLQQRQAELDAGDEKIRELISVLDQRKDESIERTFKGVARNFREVFSELVQGGYGSLIMMKKKAKVVGAIVTDLGFLITRMVPMVMTTRMKMSLVKQKREELKNTSVSFTGQGETQSMKQLSGGQKTVVALALIFAIQRCDPAPFYLFDEIDAALDPQYRTAVGNMIRRLADHANTQFITTTFRPELVKVADKIYGVTHKNRVSQVNVVTKDQALEFTEHDHSNDAE
ncbi:Structural maintenance of chromosomes protein 3-like protein [Drosera capensis]